MRIDVQVGRPNNPDEKVDRFVVSTLRTGDSGGGVNSHDNIHVKSTNVYMKSTDESIPLKVYHSVFKLNVL